MFERLHRCDLLLAALAALGAATCFVGEASEGLRCVDDRDCGIRLQCIDQRCGGGGGETTTTTEGTGTTTQDTTTTLETTGTTASNPCDDDPQCDPDLEPETCTRDCRIVMCGDGVYDDVGDEQCDASDPTWTAPNDQRCTEACHLTLFWDEMQDSEVSMQQRWELDSDSRTNWHIAGDEWRSGAYLGQSALVTLRTREIELPASLPAGTALELRFSHRYEFDICGGSMNTEPDGGVVRVVIGDREPEVVTPSAAGTLDPATECESISQPPNPLHDETAYVGAGQDDVSIDLTRFVDMYPGEILRIEFVAAYDCSNCGPTSSDAWRIDGVELAPFPVR
jgi:hypothetical protein